MIHLRPFPYRPTEHERERASNAYVMSLVAIIAGMPLPVINLIATVIFYLGNMRAAYFVRWHCTQALFSQFSLMVINGVGFWWTMSVLFRGVQPDNQFVGYLITALLFNILEFVATIYTAVQVRKGIHVEWWFYGDLTHTQCKPELQ